MRGEATITQRVVGRARGRAALRVAVLFEAELIGLAALEQRRAEAVATA
jgi:hypothetical protein